MIKRLGKSRQYVTAIANERRRASVATYARFAKALDVANERRRASVATYARFAKALDVPLAALFDGYPIDSLE